MVIKIDQVHPCLYLLACFRKKNNNVSSSLSGARRSMYSLHCPISHGRRRCFDPSEDFTIAFSGGELLEQGSRIEAKEVDDALVERSVVINSPFLPMMVARPLSSMSGRVT